MSDTHKQLYYTPNGKLSAESLAYEKVVDTAYKTKDEYESGVAVPSAFMFAQNQREARTNFYTALTQAGDTPDIFKDIGFPDLPLAVSSEHIIKGPRQSAVGFHQHDDSYEFLREIPEALKHPFMITSIYNQEVVDRGYSDALNVFTYYNGKVGMFTISPYACTTGLHHSNLCNAIVKFVEKKPSSFVQNTMLKYISRYCIPGSPGRYLYFDKELYNSIPAEYKPEKYQEAPMLKMPDKSIEHGAYCGKETNMARSEKELSRHSYILCTSIIQTLDYLEKGQNSQYPCACHRDLEKAVFDFSKLSKQEKTPEVMKAFAETLRSYLPDTKWIEHDSKSMKTYQTARKELECFIDKQLAKDPIERKYVQIITEISKGQNIEFSDKYRDELALVYAFPSVPGISQFVHNRICSNIPEPPVKGMCSYIIEDIKNSVSAKIEKSIDIAYDKNPNPEETAQYFEKMMNVAAGKDKEFNALKRDFLNKCKTRNNDVIAIAKSKMWGYLKSNIDDVSINKGIRLLHNEVKDICIEQLKAETRRTHQR